MEINLDKLKNEFNTIKDIRNDVSTLFTVLDNQLNKLKQTYLSFVTNNKQNLFIFGLDSFQFQSKMIDIEYDDTTRLFLVINNKMYCEYYKLYKIIAEYVKENIINKKTIEMLHSKGFPIYKDLEPFKQYKFEIIQEMHESIILLLYSINDFIVEQERELQIHKQQQESGLHINNFVTTFNYNIMLIREKGILFISYIHFFHSLHTKYLQRFYIKLNVLYKQITHDICFDESISSLKNEMCHKNDDVIPDSKQQVEDIYVSNLQSHISTELTNSSKLIKNIKNTIKKINIFSNVKSPRTINVETIPPLNLTTLCSNVRLDINDIEQLSVDDKEKDKDVKFALENVFETSVSEQYCIINDYPNKIDNDKIDNNDTLIDCAVIPTQELVDETC
jgi:hypothetical protein